MGANSGWPPSAHMREMKARVESSATIAACCDRARLTSWGRALHISKGGGLLAADPKYDGRGDMAGRCREG
eukprot:2100359-Pleurochrysis_carterae.AAC.1